MSLYPLVTPERIISDFGYDRCMSESMIRKYYRDENLDSPVKARKKLLDNIVNRTIVFDEESRKPVEEWLITADERIEAEYKKAKKLIWKDVELYEE